MFACSSLESRGQGVERLTEKRRRTGFQKGFTPGDCSPGRSLLDTPRLGMGAHSKGTCKVNQAADLRVFKGKGIRGKGGHSMLILRGSLRFRNCGNVNRGPSLHFLARSPQLYGRFPKFPSLAGQLGVGEVVVSWWAINPLASKPGQAPRSERRRVPLFFVDRQRATRNS